MSSIRATGYCGWRCRSLLISCASPCPHPSAQRRLRSAPRRCYSRLKLWGPSLFMRKTFSIGTVVFLGLFGSTFMLPASADELVMPPVNEMPPHPVILPHRGPSQGTVLKEFGEPAQRHAAVGGGTPQPPPLPRRDRKGGG